MEQLNKDNFWNEMHREYPKAMKEFLAWIDEYKKTNNWSTLYGEKKFHELPTYSQLGLWTQFKMGEQSIKDKAIAEIGRDLKVRERELNG